MNSSLYDRVVRQGTIAEPNGVPDPQFALPSTVNWMRALTILLDPAHFTFQSASIFYSSVGVGSCSVRQTNTALEQIFISLHQLSALKVLQTSATQADVARLAVVCWYYGLYYAASAMIAAQDGSFQDDHAGTANSWDRHFAGRHLAIGPFAYRVSSIVESKTKAEITQLRAGNRHDLLVKPATPNEALGAAAGYLSGTASWYRWRTVEDLRKSKEFKLMEVNDFRTKQARELRDNRLDRKSVGFLHEASRYRGKANYREALFLGYGLTTETLLQGFTDDLTHVFQCFLVMASAFVSKRVGSTTWSDFVADVEAKKAFSVSSQGIWT